MSKRYRVSLPVGRTELTQLLTRLQEDTLQEPDRQLLMHLVQQLLGPTAKSTSAGPPAATGSESATGSREMPCAEPDTKRSGHGRRSAWGYPGAQRVHCVDSTRQAGNRCGCGGRLYDTREPQVFLRFTGQPLVGATQYEQPVLRCSSCQQRFPAPLPEGVPAEKYDATADVAIVMAKYAAGLPFHRLARMQQSFGVPLTESVQWERCETVADALLPIYRHFPREAAQADVLIGDDTRVQILSCAAENQQRAAAGERCGLHTTGLVAQSPASTQHTTVLYSSGRKHTGENVGDLLRFRSAELAPPLQVGDALAANWSHGFPVIAVKCLAHARRQFTDIEDLFPHECAHVREVLATVYRYDADTQKMNPAERLAHHQRYSAPVMEALRHWIDEQLQQRRVEPNSALGKAFSYVQRHWNGLTQFLSQRHATSAQAGGPPSKKRTLLPHRTRRRRRRHSDERDRDLPREWHSRLGVLAPGDEKPPGRAGRSHQLAALELSR